MTWDFPGCQLALTAKGRDNTLTTPGHRHRNHPPDQPAQSSYPDRPYASRAAQWEKPQITTLIKLRYAALGQVAAPPHPARRRPAHGRHLSGHRAGSRTTAEHALLR